MSELEINCELAERIICAFIREEISKAGFTRGIIGMSGGIDSSVTAVLAVRALGAENIQWLKQNPELFQHIINYYRQFSYPFIPELDPDASLYQIGFYSRNDETTCRAFHRASPEKKAKLIDQFSSPDARALARRVLCRNYPSHVPDSFLREFNQYLQQVNPGKAEDAIVDYRQNRRTTPAQAIAEITKLKQAGELSSDRRRLLDDLEAYIRSRFS